MTQQIVDAPVVSATQASFSTAGETEASLYEGKDGYLRLYVLTGDGSQTVEFVHELGDDRDESLAFLWSLTRHAHRMIEALHPDAAA